jgi:hypothetical protein
MPGAHLPVESASAAPLCGSAEAGNSRDVRPGRLRRTPPLSRTSPCRLGAHRGLCRGALVFKRAELRPHNAPNTSSATQAPPPHGPQRGSGMHTHFVRGVSTMPRKRLPRNRLPPAFEHTVRSNVVNTYLTRTVMSVLRPSGRQASSAARTPGHSLSASLLTHYGSMGGGGQPIDSQVSPSVLGF